MACGRHSDCRRIRRLSQTPVIVRVHRHEKGFICLDNRTVRDKRLSYRARGILSYLLSLPGDNVPTSTEIADEVREGEGRDAIRAGLRELEAHGYLVREKERREDGTFGTVVHVFERPEDWKTGAWKAVPGATSKNGNNPQVEPETGKPAPDNQALSTKDKNQRHRRRKDARADARNSSANGEPDPKVKSLVAYYVDECGKLGVKPIAQWKARVGRQIRQLLGEGKDEKFIKAGLRIVADERKPGSLVYVVADLEADVHKRKARA